MADYVTAIRTPYGDKKIDYNALANKPTATSLGAVPKTTTVNGKSLAGNIKLTAGDVGALPTQQGTTGQVLGFVSTNVVGAISLPQVTAVSNGGTGVTSFEDKNYTTLRYRGTALYAKDNVVDPTVNGTINWMYE